jgi:hypothetical protein
LVVLVTNTQYYAIVSNIISTGSDGCVRIYYTQWDTKWNPELKDGGCAKTSVAESHNTTAQHVVWIVDDSYKACRPREGGLARCRPARLGHRAYPSRADPGRPRQVLLDKR